MNSPFFIINPTSGGKKAIKLWEKLERHIRREFDTIQICKTTCRGEAIRLAQEAVENGEKWIVSVGGDGTLHEITNGIIRAPEEKSQEVMLSILPMGSGDDFVKTVGLPKDPLEIVKEWKKRKKRKIDVGEISFKQLETVQKEYFLNITDFGLGGRVVRTVNQSSKWAGGKLTYLYAVVESIIRSKPWSVRIETETESFELENLVLGVVANGRYFANGLCIAPEANIEDGFFDLILIQKFGVPEFFKLTPKLYRGEKTESKKIKHLKAKEIKVTPLSKEPVYLDTDGEPFHPLPVSFRVLSQRLNLL